MAVKAAVRRASMAKAPKKAARKARRATRRAARKARRAAKPKAPKAARKARKAKAPKKATKAKKPKKITRKMQTGKMWQVLKGTKMFTSGGLMKKDLCLNKRGKVVSKKSAASAKKKSGPGTWMHSVKMARKELGITGFVLMNKGKEGIALYKKAKAMYAK